VGVRGDRKTPTKLNIAKRIPQRTSQARKIQLIRFICPYR